MQLIKLQELSVEELKEIIKEVVCETNERLPHCESPEEYLTREETACLLKISLPTLNSYTKQGILKGYRLNGRVLYKRSEVEAAPKPIPTSKYRRASK